MLTGVMFVIKVLTRKVNLLNIGLLIVDRRHFNVIYAKKCLQAPKIVLVIHKRVHYRENAYKFYVCNKSFNQINQLTPHRLTHFRSKTFQCDICK